MPNVAATLSLNFPAITALCKGDAGNSILNGAGIPGGLIGDNGDFYIDTSTYFIYGPKAGGVWGGGTLLNNNSAAPIWFSTSSTVSANSGKWENAYTFVRGNSARYQSSVSTLSALSARWESNYTNSRAYSARWDTTYMQVSALSAAWNSGTTGSVYTTVQAYSARWETTYSQVSTLSASWGGGGGGGGADGTSAYDLLHDGLSARLQSTTTTVSTFSARWDTAYTTVTSNQLNWNWAYNNSVTGTENWDTAYTNSFLVTLSGDNWSTSYNTTNQLSAAWQTTSTTMSSESGKWDSVYLTVTDSNTGLSLSAQNYWNVNWNDFEGPSGQLVPDERYNPGYTPGNRPTEWVSRKDLYDQLGSLFTGYYPVWQLLAERVVGSGTTNPVLTIGIDSILPQAVTPAGSVSATNAYVLSADAAHTFGLLNRIIINASTTTGNVIRIPYQTDTWPIGSYVKILQLGTVACRVSAEAPSVLKTRWNTIPAAGPVQTLPNIAQEVTLIKTSTTDWYVVTSSQ